ncbi:MAG TPA: hypothetical protein DIS98_14000, partial [Colwellia sp.]|nr:hypothetical protein [Colwellia sp.]
MLTNEIAIVGIDSQFGEFANIDRVARALYVGKQVGKGIGRGLDEGLGNEINIANTTINGVTNDSITRMLGALSFGKLAQQEKNRVLKQLDVIVICEQSLDLESNVKVEGHINSVTVVSHLSEALKLALPLIDKGRFVALSGLNLATSSKEVEQNTVENTDQNNKTISFDGDFNGYQSTSGIASLLLAPLVIAKQSQLSIYAQLNGLSISAVNADAMKAAILKSLKSIDQKQISLIEVSALEDEFHSDLESSVLLEAYANAYEGTYAGDPLTRAISCARS